MIQEMARVAAKRNYARSPWCISSASVGTFLKTTLYHLECPKRNVYIFPFYISFNLKYPFTNRHLISFLFKSNFFHTNKFRNFFFTVKKLMGNRYVNDGGVHYFNQPEYRAVILKRVFSEHGYPLNWLIQLEKSYRLSNNLKIRLLASNSVFWWGITLFNQHKLV